MRLRYDESVEAFRAELLEWLAANRPSPEEMAADPSVSTGHAPAWARRWTRTMFDAGWLVPGWPPELGGRSAGPIETLVFIEELAKAKVPRTTNVQGLGIVAPSILDYGSEAQIRDAAQAWLMRHARAVFTQRLDLFAPRVGVQWTKLSLSNADTRWGSASADGRIRLNWRLIHLSMDMIDYVVVHELSHLHHMDHSPRFWDVVASVMPDHAERRRALKDAALPLSEG